MKMEKNKMASVTQKIKMMTMKMILIVLLQDFYGAGITQSV
jgi:hypothetical protein